MKRKVETLPLKNIDLDGIEMLSSLDAETRARLAGSCVGVRAAAGSEIISYLDEGDSVFFVVDGEVRVNMISTGGRQITYQILGIGDMFGEMAAIDGLPRSASVVAETEVFLVRMPASLFLDLASSNPELSLTIMRRLTSLSRWLAARVFEYHAYNVKGRIYLELLRLSDAESSQTSIVGISDRDMASRVGTTRENVTRIYGELKKANIIQRSPDGVSILNRDGLVELLVDCEFS